MRILLVKTSSLGDLIHTSPAVSDIQRHRPGAEVTWVAEETLAGVPTWHPGVEGVLSVPLRRWRKEGVGRAWRETKAFAQRVRETKYDLVVDAQGLLKSAGISLLARKRRTVGYGWGSAREPLASILYGNRVSVSTEQPAIQRTRSLLARALGYEWAKDPVEFGIGDHFQTGRPRHGIVLIPGASWTSKLWPLEAWKTLTRRAAAEGQTVTLIWGTEKEQSRALQIQDGLPGVTVAAERKDLEGVARILAGAQGVVGLDTGFTHLAAALDVPTVALFGPTSPERVGLMGEHTRNLGPGIECHPCHQRICPLDAASPPCQDRITPDRVWETLGSLPGFHDS